MKVKKVEEEEDFVAVAEVVVEAEGDSVVVTVVTVEVEIEMVVIVDQIMEEEDHIGLRIQMKYRTLITDQKRQW